MIRRRERMNYIVLANLICSIHSLKLIARGEIKYLISLYTACMNSCMGRDDILANNINAHMGVNPSLSCWLRLTEWL